MRVRRMVAGVFLCAIAPLLCAQPAAKAAVQIPPSSPKRVVGTDFGTTSVSYQSIPAVDFDPDGSGTTFTSTFCPDVTCFPIPTYLYLRYVTGGFPHLLATPRLPGGAHVSAVELDYCDTNGIGKDMDFRVWDCNFKGQCNATPLYELTTHGTDGCMGVLDLGALNYTVDNQNKRLLLDVSFGAFDGSNLLAGAAVGYTLQVSAAPGTATFNDVPLSDPAFQYIEALASSGITGGCGSGNYCPDATLTRRQMAVFLAKALGLDWKNY